MDTIPSITTAECAGGATVLQLADGGNGNVDYTLFDESGVVVGTSLIKLLDLPSIQSLQVITISP
jgi:hypothetical protein